MGFSFFIEYLPTMMMLSFLAKTDNGYLNVAGVGVGIVNQLI